MGNYLEIFDNSNPCINYITNLKNEHVLYIVFNLADRCILIFVQDLSVGLCDIELNSSKTLNKQGCSLLNTFYLHQISILPEAYQCVGCLSDIIE